MALLVATASAMLRVPETKVQSESGVLKATLPSEAS